VASGAEQPDTPVSGIDGPVSSGKSSLAGRVAAALGWHHLDSGSLYRLVAATALARKVSLEDEQALADLALGLRASTYGSDGGTPVSELSLRSETVSAAASTVAAYPAVRRAIFALQRSARRAPGLVADGRDMGTVIFPDAPLKVFLEASAEVRAKRRIKQLKNNGLNVSFRALLAGIRERDARDRGRAAAPLRPAEDAIVVDSTQMSLEQVLGHVLALAQAQGIG